MSLGRRMRKGWRSLGGFSISLDSSDQLLLSSEPEGGAPVDTLGSLAVCMAVGRTGSTTAAIAVAARFTIPGFLAALGLAALLRAAFFLTFAAVLAGLRAAARRSGLRAAFLADGLRVFLADFFAGLLV